MKEDQDKLNHLHGGQILLPPEIPLHSRTTGRQEVVEVHDTVDSRVEEWSKSTLTSSNKPGTPPAEDWESSMMNHMQWREMTKLLASNKEDGVSQINELGEVVPPGQVESSLGERTVRVVNRLTNPVILT